MYEALLLVFLIVKRLALVGLVMLQQGKGADMGASFGAGVLPGHTVWVQRFWQLYESHDRHPGCAVLHHQSGAG
ncbi:preprotein translocase subunit SecG [Klebsiella pneumoniae]|nr:preprotein translocase subunit SecG [Klebsiella pneumoniae]